MEYKKAHIITVDKTNHHYDFAVNNPKDDKIEVVCIDSEQGDFLYLQGYNELITDIFCEK
jgi:hypothetical protein